MFLQSVPVAGSLIAGGFLLAVVVAAFLYGRRSERAPRAAAEREPLKKAA
jgi:hypothetical protein